MPLRHRLPAVRRLALAALSVALLAGSVALADPPGDPSQDPSGRVARISVAQGSVSMQPAGTDAWVGDVVNRPLTTGDKLWADRESRVELHIGSTAVRLASETGIEILNIDDDTVQLKLSAGSLQLHVRTLSGNQRLEVATPIAAVAVLSPGQYRIDVNADGDQLRVAASQGQLAVTDRDRAATVQVGQLATYYGSVDQVQLDGLPPGDAFDQWASDRDRREDRAVSSQYVSREMIGYEDLDDYGSWRTVDEYGPVWVPAVAVGWAPYREGHWAWVAPWGWTWVDAAPWGFAPFHYGRWVYVGRSWGWTPGPRQFAPVYAPALVGWVGGAHWSVGIGVGAGGPPVGWFPLGWNEVYVPSYRVSNTYVRNVNVTNIHVTNEYITNYVANNRGAGDSGAPVHYRNLAVTGAVTATSRTAFTSAQPVAQHIERVPREAIDRASVASGAPAIAPTAQSVGRPASAVPAAGRELWTRTVIARVPAPPPPPSFESQRRAVVQNGGLPVPVSVSRAPRGDRPDGGGSPAASRPDVVRAAPAGQPRTAPAAPGTSTDQRATRPTATGGRPPVQPATPAPRDARPPPNYQPPARDTPPATTPVPPPARPVAPRDYSPPPQPPRPAPQPAPRDSYTPPTAAPRDYSPPPQPPRPAPQPAPRDTYAPPVAAPRDYAPPPTRVAPPPAPRESYAPPPAARPPEQPPAAPPPSPAPPAAKEAPRPPPPKEKDPRDK